MKATDAMTDSRRTRWPRAVLATLLAALLVAVSPVAHAATSSTWADWTGLSGSAGAYAGSVDVAPLPQLSATFTSNSRGGSVGVISGESVWLSEGTPVGAKYGTSRGSEYLNLRPRADTSTGASTTTYAFATPTPVSGWTFVLGDIDADQVTIRAIGPDGAELPAPALGFQGGFNYCAPTVAGRPSCAGDALDVPVWDPLTRTLRGNEAAVDTSGAAAWFEPTQPISSLTFVFQRRSGFPVYQTWFASLARDITGIVTDVVDGPVSGVPVRLLDATGAVIAETSTDDAGSYSLLGVVAAPGYTVEIDPPIGKTGVDGTRKPADLTSADAVVPFSIREIIPVPVPGTVTDADGGLSGVTVTLTGDGGTYTVLTSSDGGFFFDTVPPGEYQASVTAPDGYTVITSPGPFIIPVGSETPIGAQDFVLAEQPTLSGHVLAGGVGVGGVTVTAVGDRTYTTVTAADGSYAFPRIDPDDYEVTITPPPGYTASGPVSRDETVATADLGGVDFALALPGAITGTVTTDGGAPIAGAQLTVVGPDGTATATTNDAGEYALDGVGPGQYTVTVTTPAGYRPPAEPSQTVTITDAGNTADASFVLAAIPAPTPSPSPTPDPQAPPLAGALPATGAESGIPLLAGAALVTAGLLAAAAAGITRSRRR
ncbi:MAG: carboxypeptidase regulatory-like domain-containing protein [Microbacterium sp.]